MDKAVARLNIEHFRRLLTSETDDAKRRTLERLLQEEEAKLRLIESAARNSAKAKTL